VSEARRFAVFGDPIEHSRSPAMHAAAFAALGLPHAYGRQKVAAADLGAALEAAWNDGLSGLNLTVPHKVAALEFVERRSEAVARIGATNTLVRGQRGWVAHNTEVAGAHLRSSCSSWYIGANIAGKPRVFMPYIGGFPRYMEACEAVAAGDYAEFRRR